MLTPPEDATGPQTAGEADRLGWLEPVAPVETRDTAPPSLQIEYTYAAAGSVRPSWIARPLFGRRSFKTRSLRGLLFASTAVVPMACVALLAAIVWLMLFVNRAVTTADLAFVVASAGIGWVLWEFVRQLWC